MRQLFHLRLCLILSTHYLAYVWSLLYIYIYLYNVNIYHGFWFMIFTMISCWSSSWLDDHGQMDNIIGETHNDNDRFDRSGYMYAYFYECRDVWSSYIVRNQIFITSDFYLRVSCSHGDMSNFSYLNFKQNSEGK